MRPIWESASRPLFVRSVWQEAIGRRHFILDYEPRQRQRWKRQKTRLRGSDQQSQSCEFYEQSTEESEEYLDEYLLLDATKLTLQQQQSLPALGGRPGPAPSLGGGQRDQRHNSRQSKRRAWLLSRGRTYHLDHQMDHHSRRSSLQDAASSLTTTANNPEERLAERVLHWLDLAGRTDIVKEAVPVPSPPVATSSAQLAKSAHRLQRSQHRSMSLKRVAAAAAANHQRSVARKPIAKPPPSAQQVTTSPASISASNANAKPITIIFNKEGVPVRLNRPARNIDLCTLSSSASTTRRLAGQLASARLYSGASASPLTEDSRTPPLSSRGMASAASDSRKQLHIFMPSLPKKGLLAVGSAAGSGIGGSGEDALSTSFSELCQL
ncbi:uncharacterized protein LOC128255616 [Drosophila gunungcola]|uniref:Uncharacterized protein n=1 Tax=Drosophila gunungcola TaxID=103775 RepID=A0A9Q0BN20_9MUSC|nr:uncharacterized protein LOC128255616 [Drosophila gunungcola]KAI8037610.1 hypothetical protein M5D96_009771 [Drosophila gunungcola]